MMANIIELKIRTPPPISKNSDENHAARAGTTVLYAPELGQFYIYQ
jgi:hypothetical protein